MICCDGSDGLGDRGDFIGRAELLNQCDVGQVSRVEPKAIRWSLECVVELTDRFLDCWGESQDHAEREERIGHQDSLHC